MTQQQQRRQKYHEEHTDIIHEKLVRLQQHVKSGRMTPLQANESIGFLIGELDGLFYDAA